MSSNAPMPLNYQAGQAPAYGPAPAFTHTSYLVRRKVLKLFGGAFHIYGPAGELIGFSKMKAFKLKEDIRVYTDEEMRYELLIIQARQMIDWGASYDVWDPAVRQKVGALRRKAWKSFVKDEWLLLDPWDREIGLIQEQGSVMALARRFIEWVSVIFPQRYVVSVAGQPVATFQQNYNPFVYKLNVDMTGVRGYLDPRLCLAAAIMMAAVEGKQG